MPRFLPLLIMTGLVLQVTHAQTPAQRAFQLRLQGQLEPAKVLLEQTLQKEPDDAAAYYELARVQYHLALGKPQELAQHMTAAAESISKAIKLDDQPVQYHTFAGQVAFMRAYLALLQQQPELKTRFAETCAAFETALQRQPNNPVVLLYLVELHANFPAQAGADRAKAKHYVQQLEADGSVWACQARSILAPKTCDVKAWQTVLDESGPARAVALEELGKCHLRADQVDAATQCFKKAIALDATKAYLWLDLSLYHTWQAIEAGGDRNQRQACARAGLAAIQDYLAAQPIQPLRAYALGVQSKYQAALGDNAASQASLAEARALDPDFSKATGAPHPDLFTPPGEVAHRHRYLMRRY